MSAGLGRCGSDGNVLEFESRIHDGVLLKTQHWGNRARGSWSSLVSQPNLMDKFQANETPCLKAQGEWYPASDNQRLTLDLHNTQTQMDQKMESSNALP